jgi:hypothetical protein
VTEVAGPSGGASSAQPVTGVVRDSESSAQPVAGVVRDSESSAQPVRGVVRDSESSAQPVRGVVRDSEKWPATVLREFLRCAKGADARRQSKKELVNPSGGAPNTATVLREFLKGATLTPTRPTSAAS